MPVYFIRLPFEYVLAMISQESRMRIQRSILRKGEPPVLVEEPPNLVGYASFRNKKGIIVLDREEPSVEKPVDGSR